MNSAAVGVTPGDRPGGVTSRRPASAPSGRARVGARPDGRILDRAPRRVGPGSKTRARSDPRRSPQGSRAGLPRRSARGHGRHRAVWARTARARTSPPARRARLAAAKLIAGAPRAAGRLGVPAQVTYARRRADGRRASCLAELARERRLAAGASFEGAEVTYAGCAAAVVADVDPETGAVTLPGRGQPTSAAPSIRAGRRPAGRRRRIRHRQHHARSLVYDGDGQLLSSTLMDYALPAAADVRPSTAIGRCAPPPARSACAASAYGPGPRRRDRPRR
jgi:carbon-monoxide dehydrogenase large subunit